MSYIARVLQPGETVVHRTRLHWIVFAQSAVLLIAAVALAIGANFVASSDLAMVMLIAAALLGGVGVIVFLATLLRRLTTELAITDRRVIHKRGLIKRHTLEMNLAKVESVRVSQSILGRMLGYGEVEVRGTGSSLEPLALIADPLRFRSFITGHE